MEYLVYLELWPRGQQRIGSPGGLGNFRPPSSLLTLPPYYTQSGFTKTAAKFSAWYRDQERQKRQYQRRQVHRQGCRWRRGAGPAARRPASRCNRLSERSTITRPVVSGAQPCVTERERPSAGGSSGCVLSRWTCTARRGCWRRLA